MNYQVELLKTLDPFEHSSKSDLKCVATNILRIFDPLRHSNGNRHAARKRMPQIIEVPIPSVCGEGEDVFIRIIHLIPTSRIISFKRLQL